LPVPAAFPELQILENVPTLSSMERVGEECLRIIDVYKSEQVGIENQRWLTNLAAAVRSGVATAIDKINSLVKIADICEELSDVAYEFLFNKSTSLFRIGYNVDEQRKDDSYYDMLASEARLGIFVAIAQGKIPQESWFSLGRLLTNSSGGPILLSWSGS